MSRSTKVSSAILLTFLLGVLLVVAPDPNRPAQALDADSSCWTGTWSQWPRWDPMYLAQNGNTVSGNYDYDKGRLSGTLDGDTLSGEWSEYPSYAPPDDGGSFVFTISPDCNSFDGHFNYGPDDDKPWMGWGGERIDLPGRVAARVENPTVSYRGLEYEPGDTFFPNTCSAEGRVAGSEPCEDSIALQKRQDYEDIVKIVSICVFSKISRVFAILEMAGLNAAEEELVMSIASQMAFEKCTFGLVREPAELDFTLYQGVARISSLEKGVTLSVDVQLATATFAEPGTFAAGYHPETNEAVFVAYSGPLVITPIGGTPSVLPPYHEVTLTPDGFSPVTELLRVHVPVVVRPATGQ